MNHSFYYDEIDLHIDRDSSTALPLFSEQEKILSLVLNYLPLPYSVLEYGCGKKASMIISKLVDLGVPPYAIQRGMIIEKDMSTKMLDEIHFSLRPHALIVENALFHRVDFADRVLCHLLEEAGMQADTEHQRIQAGDFTLSLDRMLQFVKARSHIFPIVSFWDDKSKTVKERVIDPTLDREEHFLVTQIRKYLNASQALILKAPMLGNFTLPEKYLTEEQYKEYTDLSTNESWNEKDIIRSMLKAEKGSIGDPTTWTYANNMPLDDTDHHNVQLYHTGEGNDMAPLFENLITQRMANHEEEVINTRAQLEEIIFSHNIRRIIAQDALWSENRLQPLILFVNTLSDHIALKEIADRIKKGEQLHHALEQPFGLNLTFGIAFRIRQRLEEFARVSRNANGQIDARALNERFVAATVLCIRQMNAAGLTVCLDKAGNIHGLLIDENCREDLKHDPQKIKTLAREAICHCSHIDTVLDGGKYDGRLGVLSGIEIAELLHDLHRFYNIATVYPKVKRPVMVSAFMGEEMTFTGEGVSMPGSAAVAGHASVDAVYKMSNQQGEVFRDKLLEMLTLLKDLQQEGVIELFNNLPTAQTADELADLCMDPQLFFTPHTYERHIEQGSLLDRKKLPLVLVETIMGIYQEDYQIHGERAEEAALMLVKRMRALSNKQEKEEIRVTSGMIESLEHIPAAAIPLDFGMRWTLVGLKNHAGSTPMHERHDAAVAMARLKDHFYEIVNQLSVAHDIPLVPQAGGIQIEPGKNRNVIPETAKVTLGVVSEKGLDATLKNNLVQSIQSYIINTLASPVVAGGEGILHSEFREVNFLNPARKVRVSMDLRGAEQSWMDGFIAQFHQSLSSVASSCNVQITKQVEQVLPPYPLKNTGQVLQLERSYGGSHNPNETELARDVLKGTFIQLSATLAFILSSHLIKNLHQLVHSYLPDRWKNKLSGFTSGALHDTCNISRRVAARD